MINVVSDSVSKTKDLGKKFSRILKAKDIILLEGQLGGGKTTFTKGIAQGFGYKGKVLSPSFTLVRKYNTSTADIYHIDLYRLEKGDLSSIDVDQYLYSQNAISVIEWGKKIEFYLNKYIRVKFLFLDIERRKLQISQKGYNKNKLQGL